MPAIGRVDTSVNREEEEVCGSPAADACRPGVGLLSDLNPSMEVVPLQQTHKHYFNGHFPGKAGLASWPLILQRSL